MTDLISRKAAIEACLEVSKQEEEHSKMWAAGLRYAKRILTKLPSVPAVPLEPLCDYLEVYARTPIYNMRHTARWWKEDLEIERQKWEAWEKNQDATN